MRAPTKRDTPATVLPVGGAGLGLNLSFETAIIAAPTFPTQARKTPRRRKTRRQHLDAEWRGLLRQFRRLHCRAVKRLALTGTDASLDAVIATFTALVGEERDAATRRKARR